jgi:hypothetical protein
MSQTDTSSPGLPDAVRLRALLGKADLSEEAAATVLEVNEGHMRAYVAAKKPVPRYVILALERIVDMRGMHAERWPVNAPGE